MSTTVELWTAAVTARYANQIRYVRQNKSGGEQSRAEPGPGSIRRVSDADDLCTGEIGTADGAFQRSSPVGYL